MNKETRKAVNETKQRLVDFFYVYFDEKTSKSIGRHPEAAIPILKEAIKDGLPTRERLSAYAVALGDAVSLQGFVTRNT